MKGPMPRALLLLLLGLSAAQLQAQHWPGFRGELARGVADGQDLPVEWDLASGKNVRWKTEIPGMGHSSPVVWGDLIFVTTAVSQRRPELVLGDEGGIDLAGDEGAHSWRLLALDRTSGRLVWEREAFSGPARAGRHVKSSQANATPATDGETVVAIFGSQGLAAFDLDGTPRWSVDLGTLDPGLFGDPTSHWGHSSSPVIYRDLVIVQVDRHRDSFLAAYDLASGRRVWQISRDEKPVWATPTLHRGADGDELIVVGGDFDRGLDPGTGRELWRFARSYEVKTPTPVIAGDLIVLAGGYRGRPIYALRSGGRGDLSAEGPAADGHLAWVSEPGGPYTSTPVAYRGRLYFVRNTGIFNVLSLASGESVHRRRLESTFSASPVASDGKIYLAGEEGVISVVRAEPDFELLAANDMGEPCMATPAISESTLFVRTRSNLYALAKPSGE